MYKLSRLMLLLTVALVLYSAVLVTALGIRQQVPPDKQGLVSALLIAGVFAVLTRKKARRLFSSGGTAAWATIDELRKAGMLHARKGLILGRIPNAAGTPLGQAVRALLSTRLNAADACRTFSDSLSRRKRKQGQLVRLPSTAVHSMIVAPVGTGKSTGLLIPFLLTCEESCVVVDFKGELSSITSEHRRRMMGHKIVILDPFKVVTQ